MKDTVSPFIAAVDAEIMKMKRRLMRDMARDLDRDMRGLPTLEAECGWRVVWRSSQDARD